MVTCAVLGCESSKKNNPHNYSFHHFPIDPVIRDKWLRMLHKPNWTPFKYSTICSKHFESRCFLATPDQKRRKLRHGSVPTIGMPVKLKRLRQVTMYHYRDIEPLPSTSSVKYRKMVTTIKNLRTKIRNQEKILKSLLSKKKSNGLTEIDHSCNRTQHFDHTYSMEPLNDLQAPACNSCELPELRLSEDTQSSQDSEVITISSCEHETLIEDTQSSQDSEVGVTCSACALETSPQVTQNLQTNQNSEPVKKEMIKSRHGGMRFRISELEACRICLATDVKLYSLKDTLLGDCMKTIAGFSISSCGGLPNFVCYECAPTVLKCAKLVEKSKTAEAILVDIIAKNGQVTKTLIERKKRSQLDLRSSLDSYLLTNYHHMQYDDDNRTSEHNEMESIPNVEKDTDLSGVENKDETNEMSDEDDNSVVEIKQDIPLVEVESSDSESDDDCISLIPDGPNNNLKTCTDKFLRKPRRKKLKKNIEFKNREEFLDIQEHFTIEEIPVNEQKLVWRQNMVTKCIETGREFICSVCENTFQNADSLKAHSDLHANIHGEFKCEVCLVCFPSKHELEYHTERIHAYRFTCKHCPMTFNNIDDAKYHKDFV
ncbi:hypothetical protein PYW07_004977 [Mythimna separata]|uniref:Uncharacterized protein n=1 Tax=Mythimna separata TaxID=271217 RepID=A0AAD7YEP5_MYTSE|nr:hypothetical protein PYW07_004977 [Mythimna separata]